MAKDERIGLRLEQIDRQRLERAAYALGYSIAEVVRVLVGDAADAGTPVLRLCDICNTPRRAEPLNDALAHAQCDQTIAELERNLA